MTSEITPQEARRIVREKLSQDWTREIPAEDYIVAPGGWDWNGAYVFNDGPADEPDEDEAVIGLGLAAVDKETGEARRLASSETFRVLTEGRPLEG